MTTDTIPAAAPSLPNRIVGVFRRHPEAFAALLIVVICIVVGTINPAFWQLANLFDILRAADRLGQPIAVAPVPRHGLGLAINDRLARAAAPR